MFSYVITYCELIVDSLFNISATHIAPNVGNLADHDVVDM